ncbi:MAG: hypothetical protein DRR16_10520 [Candidatus Parabeggiatoa sp. nov. 3]|nr:MAG: hypothetical protein DRQ99_01935 [Gammaproteobacteria bacterium]RKZ86106.1 MAG: hypothetical protein DRR16_10520 [Gammaproteobacteria bacterium]
MQNLFCFWSIGVQNLFCFRPDWNACYFAFGPIGMLVILLSARLECLLFCFRPDWNACYFREGAIDNDPFFGNAPFAYLLDISVRHEIGKRYSISIAEYA